MEANMEEFRRDSDTLKEDNINRNDAAKDLDGLFEYIIDLNNKWGSEFDGYQQDLYIDRKWTLQTLEDFICSWYNNYNADVKPKSMTVDGALDYHAKALDVIREAINATK